MRIAFLIFVLCLQLHTSMGLVTKLAGLKARFLNATGNTIQEGGSLLYKLGSLLEIYGDSGGNATLPSARDVFKLLKLN
ncbi:uncharacterized protein LOC108030189 [Drosophila biarmipes]|uniref:uncharacterized protein LOC108030189 n=1 Tax=Drosophila biarmipes TaxID=125945 RepID=UPI0007E7AA0D|nr:uncharacterized protein LOC108030189 [Drosophila biarmipes]